MLVLFVTFFWQKNDVFFVEICCIIGNKNSSSQTRMVSRGKAMLQREI